MSRASSTASTAGCGEKKPSPFCAACFLNDHEIDTGEGRLSFARAIIATGARNATPLIEGLDQVEYLTNRTALHLQELPRRMVIVGGGYIGIEFAQMAGRFGTEVTLLGRNPHLAPGEDADLSDLLAGYLREEGIDVRTGTPVVRVRQEGSEKIVTARVDGKETDFQADAVLIICQIQSSRTSTSMQAIYLFRKGLIMADCCTPTTNGADCCAVPAAEKHREAQAKAATRCPTCGEKGKRVDTQAVKALLALSLRSLQAGSYRFCRTQMCPVVYFSGDGMEQYREVNLRERVHQKHPDADDVFVCYCFRHTPGAIRAELLETGQSTVVAEIKAGIQADQCACEIRNPQGSCCLGNVAATVKRVEAASKSYPSA